MNKSTIILSLVIVGLLGYIFGGVNPIQKEGGIFGNLFVSENAYTDSTFSTSSVGSVNVKLLLQAATSTRTYARFCNVTGEAIVWLYKNSTSTGVVINQGYPIIGTSTAGYGGYNACMTIDNNDPYVGQVWSKASASTTVSVEYGVNE